MQLTLNVSTVALEHSDAISSVQCRGKDIRITLSNQADYDYLAEKWTAHGAPFILATYFPGCAGYDIGQRGFSYVESFHFESKALTVHAAISKVDVKSVTNDFQLQWGMDVPSGNETGIARRLSKPGYQTIKIDVGPRPSSLVSTSAFDSAFPIYEGEEFSAYCVGCGATGSVTLSGMIGWSKFDPHTLQSGSINLGGNMNVRLGIGVSGSASYDSPSLSKQLLNEDLPGLSIPAIITIGPEIAVDVSLTTRTDAAGSLLAGFNVVWSNFQAGLDLVVGTSSSSGWSPTLTPTFEAKGSFGVTIQPRLPVSLGVGINIFSGVYQKTVSIIDAPSFVLSATAAGGYSLNARGEEDIALIEYDTSSIGTIYPSDEVFSLAVSEDVVPRAVSASAAASASVYPSITVTTALSLHPTETVPTSLSTSFMTSLRPGTTKTASAPGTSTSEAYCSPGVLLSLGFQNVVSVKIFNLKTIMLSIYSSPSLSQCINV